MGHKVEIGAGLAAILCFAGAADAWFATGAVDILLDLCLSDADTDPAALGMPMSMVMERDVPQALAFAAGGFAFVALGLSRPYLSIGQETGPAQHITDRERKRLLATIAHIATASGRPEALAIARAYQSVTGHRPAPSDPAAACRHVLTRRSATLERILRGAKGDGEKRRLLMASVHIWSALGMDSRSATFRLEQVAETLGFGDEDIRMALDPSEAENGSVVTRLCDWVATATRPISDQLGWTDRPEDIHS